MLKKSFEYTDDDKNKAIKEELKFIKKKCLTDITNSQTEELEDNLDSYEVYYKKIIKAIKKEGTFKLKEAMQENMSIFKFKGYNSLHWLYEDLWDLIKHSYKMQDEEAIHKIWSLINSILSDAYNREELLTYQKFIQFYPRIFFLSKKTDLFKDEVMERLLRNLRDRIEYEILIDFGGENSKKEITDLLIDMFKVNVKITAEMSRLSFKSKNLEFYGKLMKFLRKIRKKIDNDLEMIKYIPGNKDKVSDYEKMLMFIDIMSFGLYSYALDDAKIFKIEDRNKLKKEILDFYSNVSFEKMSEMYKESISNPEVQNIHDWLSWEEIPSDGEMHSVYIDDKLSQLYTFIFVNALKLNKYVDPVVSSVLSVLYTSRIDNILLKSDDDRYRELFEGINEETINTAIEKSNEYKQKVIEYEKEKLRKEAISSEKVNDFKEEFVNQYRKISLIDRIMKQYDKFENKTDIYQKKKNGIIVSTVMNKSVFLEKQEMPTVFSDFEKTYAEAFAKSEEQQLYKVINSNSIKKSNMEISDIIKKYYSNQSNSAIIFITEKVYYSSLIDKDFKFPYQLKDEDIEEKADLYYEYKNKYIPVYRLSTKEEKAIFILAKNQLGKMIKYKPKEKNENIKEEFYISIEEFRGNKELQQKVINQKNEWLQKYGSEKNQTDHLKESVLLEILEVVEFIPAKKTGYKIVLDERK